MAGPSRSRAILEREARFSPDGRWVAYQSDESGRLEVYAQPFPGPVGKWRVSADGGAWPCWSRDGRELFYYFGNKMMAVDVKTGPVFAAGTPRLLFEGQFSSRYDISPDGRRFLMIQPVEPPQPATRIELVLNWFEELKRLPPRRKGERAGRGGRPGRPLAFHAISAIISGGARRVAFWKAARRMRFPR
jgi:Tol biopolymer transport system component